MLFSVVIPTFDRAHLLPATLESVFAQRCRDYEIIVVDDGSKDGTQDYLRSVKNRILVLGQASRGAGAARNLGAGHARGEYLAFLDSDDLWFPWTLSCFAELIKRYDHPTVLAAKFLEFRDDRSLVGVREDPLKADFFEDYLSSHRKGYFVGAGTSVLRRDQFISASGYCERQINGEDHDLVLRLGNARGFVQMTSPVTLGWRRHAGSATTNLHDSIGGACYLVKQERCGAYPGGLSRARARRDIITARTRPVAIACLERGLRHDAWRLYRATFTWSAALGRAKYLAAFPLLAAISKLRLPKPSALPETIGFD